MVEGNSSVSSPCRRHRVSTTSVSSPPRHGVPSLPLGERSALLSRFRAANVATLHHRYHPPLPLPRQAYHTVAYVALQDLPPLAREHIDTRPSPPPPPLGLPLARLWINSTNDNSVLRQHRPRRDLGAQRTPVLSPGGPPSSHSINGVCFPRCPHHHEVVSLLATTSWCPLTLLCADQS